MNRYTSSLVTIRPTWNISRNLKTNWRLFASLYRSMHKVSGKRTWTRRVQFVISCCSTGNKRTHRSCHLNNNLAHEFPVLHSGRCFPKMSLRQGDLGLIYGSFDPFEFTPETASRLVQPFVHMLRLWPADRQTHTENTDHATSVAISRIYRYCCDAA